MTAPTPPTEAEPAAEREYAPTLVERMAEAIPTELTATPHVGIGGARRAKIAAAIMPVVQAELDALLALVAELTRERDEALQGYRDGQSAAGELVAGLLRERDTAEAKGRGDEGDQGRTREALRPQIARPRFGRLLHAHGWAREDRHHHPDLTAHRRTRPPRRARG